MFDTLLYFVEHRGELLEKQTLLDAIWPGVVVEENNLNQAITTLRRVFGETRGENSFIVTEPGRGYRFVAQVEIVPAEAPTLPSPPAPTVAPRPHRLGPRNLGLAGGFVLLLVAVLFAIDAYRVGPTPPNVSALQARSMPSQSVAVLPFIDLSEGGEREWLVDGLTEEILNSLAQLPQLKVTGRTSSFRFRDDQRNISEIAARLGVAHVLEGSVRLVGDELRVNAQLVRTQDGFSVWSNSYDGSAGELLDFQRDVAERVADALDVVLNDTVRARMFASGTRNVEAFEAYQRGRAAIPAALAAGREWEPLAHFDEALAFDPRYVMAAIAKTGLLDTLVLRPSSASPHSVAQALELRRANLDFIVANATSPTMRLVAEINRESASPTWERMAGLLNRLREQGDFDSLQLGGDAAAGLANVLLTMREHDLTLAIAERHVAIDPLAPNSWLRKAAAEIHAGDFAAARSTFAEARRVIGRDLAYDVFEVFMAYREGAREPVIAFLSRANDPGSAMLLAAIRGDDETALRIADETEARFAGSLNLGVEMLLLTYHETAASDRLARTVRRIDDSPQGTAMFMTLITRSAGLAFDLDDAPNFAAKLDQAGIDRSAFTRLPRLSTLP